MIRILTAIAFCVLVAWGVLYGLSIQNTCPPRDETAALVRNVAAALKSYQSDHGVYPSGDYAQVCRALFGENPKREKYFEISQKGINAAGEIVDQWGTPLRVDLSEPPQSPRVRSAGKNRVFEEGKSDSDDIVSR